MPCVHDAIPQSLAMGRIRHKPMGRDTNSCFAGVRFAIASRRDTYIKLASEKYINICFAVAPLAVTALSHFDMPDTRLYQQ